MDANEIYEILKRYGPLDLIVKSAAFALEASHPGKQLQVSLSGRQADDTFRAQECRSVDGSAPLFRGDEGRDGRQRELLLGFDARGMVQGAFEWKAGLCETIGTVLEEGHLGAAAVDFALVTHREWFRAGEAPDGVPDWEVTPPEIADVELEITIFGGSGIPSPWSASDHGDGK